MSAIAVETKRTEYRAFTEIESLVRAFEKAEIARDDWNHRGHLTVACWYLLCYPAEEAVERMRDSLQRYLSLRGIVTTRERGYHETITVSWMRLVRHYLAQTNLDCSLVELINGLVEHYSDKDFLLRYYSRDSLMSLEARTGWVEPDVKPLP